MKCFICGKKLSTGGSHVYICARDNNIPGDKKCLRFKQICFDTGKVFTKEYLVEKYEKEQWSLPDFKRECGLDYSRTLFLLDYFSITKRSHIESLLTEVRRKKTINAVRAKYGVDNVSQSDHIKEKKKQTFLKHYGVDNIWKHKEYYEWLDKYMVDRFGKRRITNPKKLSETLQNLTEDEKIKRSKRLTGDFVKWLSGMTDEDKNKLLQKQYGKSGIRFISKLEIKVKDVLYKWKTQFTHQFFLGNHSFDFLIEGKIILEVQGDFWHANPKIYKPSDLLAFPSRKNKVKVSDIWKKDQKKKDLAERNGYAICYIWEDEIKRNIGDELEILLEKIINNAKNTKNKIDQKDRIEIEVLRHTDEEEPQLFGEWDPGT